MRSTGHTVPRAGILLTVPRKTQEWPVTLEVAELLWRLSSIQMPSPCGYPELVHLCEVVSFSDQVDLVWWLWLVFVVLYRNFKCGLSA